MLSPLGIKLEMLQAERGINNKDLAKLLGIKHQNIKKLKHVEKPRFSTISKVAKVFELSSEDLYNDIFI